MAIRAHHARQLAERMKAGPALVDYDLVFTTKLGGARRATPLRARFRTVRKQASMPAIHFDNLRHTWATMLAKEGMPARHHGNPWTFGSAHHGSRVQACARAALRARVDTIDRVFDGLREAV